MAKFTRKDFLGALFQDYFRKREGFIMVKSSRHTDPKTSVRYFPNIEILAKEPYQAEQEVFFGVCPHENMKPDRSGIQFLVALWAGLDLSPEGYSGKQTHFFGHSQAAKAIRSFPFAPSIIVESGWGVHLYWLLKETTRINDAETVERLLRRINTYFQCTTEVGLDTMLRLPDTVNGKVSAHLSECRVKYINSDFRYDLQEMAQHPLGAAPSLTTSTVFLGPLSQGTSDQEVATQAKSDTDIGRLDYSAGLIPRDTAALVDLIQDRADSVRSPSRSAKAVGIAAPKRVALSESEPDFQPVPYETLTHGPKPRVPHQAVSTDLLSEDALERVAEKLAEKIAEKVARKVVDEIVDKVVERLSTFD